MTKDLIINSFSEGFKDSFRLSTSLVSSVAKTVSAFSNHSPPSGAASNDGRKVVDDIKQRSTKTRRTK